MGLYRARTEGLVLDELNDGLVVYDARAHCAHWLEPSAAAAWRACDGGAEESDVASAVGTDTPTCLALLDQLTDIGLVEVVEGVSRRSMLASAAKVGAAGALAAPIISAVVPIAVAHASTGGGGSSPGGPSPGQPFVLQSGPGASGSVDPNNVSTIWNGSSWAAFGPAYNYSNGAYYVIPGTGWVSYYADSQGPTDVLTSVDPKFEFYIPAGAVNPQITGQFLADDSGTVFVNGNQVGTTTGGYSTPTPFTAALQTGYNYLSFQMLNSGGGPTGVDYQATVSYS